MEITHDFLLSKIEYLPESGIFIWKSKPSKNIASGAIAGSTHKSGRVYICIGKTRYLAHRLAWFYMHKEIPIKCIDHINGDATDNRLINLRLATHAENMQNHRKARSDSTSKLIGAMPLNRNSNKWIAQIRVNNKKIHLGTFDNKEDAHKSFVIAKRKYHAFCTI